LRPFCLAFGERRLFIFLGFFSLAWLFPPLSTCSLVVLFVVFRLWLAEPGRLGLRPRDKRGIFLVIFLLALRVSMAKVIGVSLRYDGPKLSPSSGFFFGGISPAKLLP